MISEATTMSKPSSRGTPWAGPPRPITALRSARSLTSTTRFHWMRRASMFSSLPWWMWLSTSAARVLFAIWMAWKSPVKCRLMSSIGTTWAWPPPVAPPLIPITGPSAGSRSATIVFMPVREKASARPTVVVDLPSPAGVGDIAETSTSLPCSLLGVIFRTSTLAFVVP